MVFGGWGFRYTEKAPPWWEGERKLRFGTSGHPPLIPTGFICDGSLDMAVDLNTNSHQNNAVGYNKCIALA